MFIRLLPICFPVPHRIQVFHDTLIWMVHAIWSDNPPAPVWPPPFLLLRKPHSTMTMGCFYMEKKVIIIIGLCRSLLASPARNQTVSAEISARYFPSLMFYNRTPARRSQSILLMMKLFDVKAYNQVRNRLINHVAALPHIRQASSYGCHRNCKGPDLNPWSAPHLYRMLPDKLSLNRSAIFRLMSFPTARQFPPYRVVAAVPRVYYHRLVSSAHQRPPYHSGPPGSRLTIQAPRFPAGESPSRSAMLIASSMVLLHNL